VEVTDANGEAVKDTVTLTQPDSLQVMAYIQNVSCPGGSNGFIEPIITGGTPGYNTNWDHGSSEQNQYNLSAGMYSLVVTDSHGCSAAWSGEIIEKSSSRLYGIARYSLGTIDEEEADVVLLDGSEQPYRIVSETRMQAGGHFQFNGIPDGYYLVYVKLDNHARQKYKGVMHSYYNRVYKWKEAARFFFRCDDTLHIVMDMFENPAATNGNGEIRGKVEAKENILKNGIVPYAFVTVVLIDEDTGLPVDYVVTDEEGNYVFTGIGPGNYSIYVDIPGVTQVSTHLVAIDETTLLAENIDFAVDAGEEMQIMAVFPTSTDPVAGPAGSMIEVYPNPARQMLVVRSSLFEENEARISLYSDSGDLLKTFETRPAIDGSAEIVIGLDIVEHSGSYLLKVEVGDVIMTRQVVLIK